MRTLSALLIFSLLSVTSVAQVLTNGQIYDYQVGDVFQREGQSTNMFWQQQPPNIYTDTILTREEIDGGLAIQYTIKRWHVSYHFLPQLPEVVSSIETLIVTDLDEVPDTLYQFQEPVSSLVVYNPLCGLLRWEHNEGAEVQEGDPVEYYWFYQGAGGPYFSSYFEDIGSNSYELVYVHKAGLECGTFWDLPMTTPPELVANSVRIGPNPTMGPLLAQGLGPRGAFIVNALGVRVGQVFNGIDADIGHLPAATYWLIGEDVHGKSFRAPLVKQ